MQRLTVYRHFPDREALFEACTRWYDERHPVPNVDAWRDEAHPDARLRRALADLYGYWEANESFFANVFPDLAAVPASVTGRLGSTDARMREVLLDGRPGRAVRRRTLEAAIGHALAFETWRSLVRGEGLSRPEAVDLMASFVARA